MRHALKITLLSLLLGTSNGASAVDNMMKNGDFEINGASAGISQANLSNADFSALVSHLTAFGDSNGGTEGVERGNQPRGVNQVLVELRFVQYPQDFLRRFQEGRRCCNEHSVGGGFRKFVISRFRLYRMTSPAHSGYVPAFKLDVAVSFDGPDVIAIEQPPRTRCVLSHVASP